MILRRSTGPQLQDEPVPGGRQNIERLRREANRAAVAGKRIGLGDLT